MDVLDNDAEAAQMLQMLEGCVSVDAARRHAAEEYVSSSIDQNASTAVHSFLVILSLPGNDIARRTAAVLLRKHLSRQFQRLSSEVQEEARSSLLRVMRNEQDQMLALKIAAAVAAVVSEHGAEAWPGVPADLVAMITPNEEKSVCKGCQVLHVVLEDAYAPFASALGNEALDGLARRLLHLVDAADERTALAAHRALMELASRSQEAPIPALVEAAPRLLQALIHAIREGAALAPEERKPGDGAYGLEATATLVSAFPQVALEHTGRLLEAVGIVLASDELPTVLMEETGAIVEGLSEALSQEDAGSPAVAAFVDALPLVLPPLGRSAIYSEDDPEYRRYLAAQERENEAVEEEGGEDEDEEEDEIGVLARRKASALMIHRLIEDRPDEVVPPLLRMVNNMMRAEVPGFQVPEALSAGTAPEEAWKIKEAGILLTGAMASAHLEGLEPHIPGILPVLAGWTRAENPLVAAMACWTLGQMAPYFRARVAEEGQQAADGQLAPLLGALGPCVNHEYPHVQRTATAAVSTVVECCGEHCAPYLADLFVAAQSALERPTKGAIFAGLCDLIGIIAERMPGSLSDEGAARLFVAVRSKMAALDSDSRWITAPIECEMMLLKHDGVRADPELPLLPISQVMRIAVDNAGDDGDHPESTCGAAVDYLYWALEVLEGRCAERIRDLALWDLVEVLMDKGAALGQAPALATALLQHFPNVALPDTLRRVTTLSVNLCNEREPAAVAVVPWLLASLVPVMAPRDPEVSAKVAAAAAHTLSRAAEAIDAGEIWTLANLALANAALALSAVALQDTGAARGPAAGCISAWLRGTVENDEGEESTKTWRGIAALAEHAPELFHDALDTVAYSIATSIDGSSAEDKEAWQRITGAMHDHFSDEWDKAAAARELNLEEVEDEAELLG